VGGFIEGRRNMFSHSLRRPGMVFAFLRQAVPIDVCEILLDVDLPITAEFTLR